MTGEGGSVQSFALRIEQAPGAATLWAAGELDLAAAPSLRSALVDAGRHAHRVVLDMTAVDFIDGAAIGAIVAAAKKAGPGTEIVLRHPNALAATVFHLTGLDEVFPIEP